MPAASPEISPADRTVGQLVADTIRLYQRRFGRALPLGLVVAVFDLLAVGASWNEQGIRLSIGAPVFTLAFIAACLLVLERRPTSRVFLTAFLVGVVIFIPVGLLVRLFALPALAWLAFVGLAVPAVLDEGLGFREGLRQGSRLSGAGYVHALGGLATLVLVYTISRLVLVFLLYGQADAAIRTASFLADLVLSPMIFLGSALLYLDQKARLESLRQRQRRSDARLHHAVEPDRARRPDAQVEPGSPARGEP
jgi:hypothetical protein